MKNIKVTKEEYLEAKAEMEKALAEGKEKAREMSYEESIDAFMKFSKLYNVKKVGDEE